MRQTTRCIAVLFCFALSLAVLANAAQAQTETVLYNFLNNNGAELPTSGVTFDQQGRIYGVGAGTGVEDHGVIFRLEREAEGWVFSPLYAFGTQRHQDGDEPFARVVFGPGGGVLYGTTFEGGTTGHGTVFSLQPPPTACHAVSCPWTSTILYNFLGEPDGAGPEYGDLVFDQAGNIYGTTNGGGSFGDGVVFKLTHSGSGWTESVLWSFTGGSDGANPFGGVIFDSAGNLYGTTQGAVYELSPTQSGWSETTLYSFTDPANGPGASGLIWDGHGDLFGITGGGFEGNNSVVYELTPQNGSWSFTVLQNFGFQNIGPVAPPTFDSQGNLYGPIPSLNEIFKLTPSGNQWIYSSFYQFAGCEGAAWPIGAVAFDASGNMYGTTQRGGSNCLGTVWEITP